MSRVCLFCGVSGPGTLSKEHIVPLWLLKFVGAPPDDLIIHGVAETATGRLAEPPRIHSSFTFVDGRVCESDCNNGWMSRLEDAARPILIPLMEDRGLETLSPQEAVIVGKWAAKTAYLHTWGGKAERPVQLEHLRALNGDQGVAVEGVTVFAAKADHKSPTAYVGGGNWLQIGTPQTEANGEPPRAAYKVGLQFGCLHLLVAFWPDPRSVLLPAEGLHSLVFPPGLPLEFWKPPLSLRQVVDSPIGWLSAFANCLAVAHRF